jgi:hypothetical protein
MKDIVYDLIQSKLRIKELEDKIVLLESENVKLTNVNLDLNKDINKWKSHVVSYIDDYRNIYLKSTGSIENSGDVIKKYEPKEEMNKVVEVNTIANIKEDNLNTEDKIRKARNEYMKEYMRNKRKQQREENKKVSVNKK